MKLKTSCQTKFQTNLNYLALRFSGAKPTQCNLQCFITWKFCFIDLKMKQEYGFNYQSKGKAINTNSFISYGLTSFQHKILHCWKVPPRN